MARTNTTQLVDSKWYYSRGQYRVLKVWVIYDMGITWLFRPSNDYEITNEDTHYHKALRPPPVKINLGLRFVRCLDLSWG